MEKKEDNKYKGSCKTSCVSHFRDENYSEFDISVSTKLKGSYNLDKLGIFDI